MGYFGNGNLGDAAIQQAMIEQIRSYFPNTEISGISMNPDDTQHRYGIDGISIGRIGKYGWYDTREDYLQRPKIIQNIDKMRSHPSKYVVKLIRFLTIIPLEIYYLYRAYKKLDGYEMLSHSGGQFDDPWGGAWNHPYTFLVWALIAKIRRVKLLFVSSGGGPLNSTLSSCFIRIALSLADYCSFRDQQSKAYMRSIGYKKNVRVYPDLAHSLDIEKYQHDNNKNSKQKIIGIGPMAYKDPRYWPIKNKRIYEYYISKLADFVEWLILNNYQIKLIPGEAYADRDAILDVVNLLKHKSVEYQKSQLWYEPIITVDELISTIATLDCVVASRFHSLVLSLLMNKPAIALSYHNKIEDLMVDVGEQDFVINIESFELYELREKFIELEQNQEELKEKISRRVDQYRSALEEQYEIIFRQN